MLVSDVVKPVLAFLGRPSQAALPYQDLIEVVSRKVSKRILDLLNSDRNYQAKVVPLTPSSRDIALNRSGVVVRIESRPFGSTSDDAWEDWTESDYGDWNTVLGRSGRHFATYGSPTRIAFSSDVANQEFRALVESGDVTLTSLSDDTKLTDVLRPLLFTDTALEAGAMVHDSSAEWERLWTRKERHLRLELPKLERDWTRHINMKRNQGVQYREAFNSNRVYSGITEDASGWLRSD